MAQTERFNLTLTTKDGVTPAQIAEALVAARLVDPDLEIVHILKLADTDIQIEPGSTRMMPISSNG